MSALLIQPRLLGEDDSPPILDRSTHERLLALRRDRRRSPGTASNGNGHRRYLLSGLLRCWRCGGRLSAAARKATGQPCYRCPSRGAGGCSGVVIPAPLANAAALDAVAARIDDREFIRGVEERAARLAEEEHRMATLLAEAVAGRASGTGQDGLWTSTRTIDDEAWRRLRAQVENRVRAPGSELGAQSLLLRQRKLCRSGDTLRSSWDTLDLDARRATVESVVDHFVVLPARMPPGSIAKQRLEPVWCA